MVLSFSVRGNGLLGFSVCFFFLPDAQAPQFSSDAASTPLDPLWLIIHEIRTPLCCHDITRLLKTAVNVLCRFLGCAPVFHLEKGITAKKAVLNPRYVAVSFVDEKCSVAFAKYGKNKFAALPSAFLFFRFIRLIIGVKNKRQILISDINNAVFPVKI